MRFVGRARELGRIRRALDAPGAALVVLSGPRGCGKTALLRRALAPLAHLHFSCPPLPDPLQRRALAERIHGQPLGGGPPAWRDLLEAFATSAGGGGALATLVLDDAHRLVESRARMGAALEEVLTSSAVGRAPLRVILAGRGPDLTGLLPPGDAAAAAAIEMGPLPFRAAAPLLPGRSPADKLRAYAVFGGLPARLALLDRSATPRAELRRLVTGPGAPLADEGIAMLERAFQAPPRYVAILAALAGGEADWKTVHRGVPDLTTSGQLAPYLEKLRARGWVETRASLDAPPGSRGRRYRIVDPFHAFWLRWALAAAGRGDDRSPAPTREVWDAHVESIFPSVCRDFMEHDAIELFGANAREVGSLWGPGYEIGVAGILRTGAAFYGDVSWTGRATPTTLTALDAGVRETRYGFGRERRLRLLFRRGGFSAAVQRAAARRDDAWLVGVEELAGTTP